MAAPKGHEKWGGRVAGVPNKRTVELKALLIDFCPAVITELVRLSTKAESEQVRVMAIKEIFDRVYGKPVQAIVGADNKPLLDPQQNLAMIARKVALAFRLAAMADKETPMIESEKVGPESST